LRRKDLKSGKKEKNHQPNHQPHGNYFPNTLFQRIRKGS
jgi:hypothetical protein